MKTLVVYYSRTGTTRKVAEIIKEKLRGDIEEITAEANFFGLLGYMRCGFQAFYKKMPKIRAVGFDLGSYDFVVIGTPVWAGNMSSPIRTFLAQQKENFKQVAFFCTHSSTGCGNTFNDMSALVGKEPIARLGLQARAVAKEEYAGAIEEFVYEIIEKTG